MIESWVGTEAQLASCTNITCTSKQPLPFNRSTEQECLQAGRDTEYPPAAAAVDVGAAAVGAGANGELWHGMVQPFVNMTVKGWTWYQGENNLAYHAGNVLDKDGYACMLPTMIGAWRAAWSVDAKTTDPQALPPL